ncbi:MAG: nucleotidyltransferase domain-containing protein [Nanoarchaeota archaeon]
MFNQKFEPEEGKIIHGAGQDLQSFKEYSDAVENYKPAIYMTYVKINEIEKWSNKIFLEIKDMPIKFLQIGFHLRKKEDRGVYVSQCAEILRGTYDTELRLFCEILKKMSIPTFLRIGYEFNELNKYNHTEFIASWRYLTNKLKEFKIDNVATVWCSCPAMSKNINEIMAFYPGDEHVDWFGIDILGAKNFKNDKLTEEFIREAEEHKKPVMIGECSAIRTNFSNEENAWNSWFALFFEWLYKHPIIKAFCYINWDWCTHGEKWKEWGNSRIQTNENLRKRYVEELSKSIFIHNDKEYYQTNKPKKILYENQDKILKKILDLLRNDIPQNAEAILFGSLAESKFGKYVKKHNNHEGSDIDIIVFIDKKNIPPHWKYLNVSKGWWDLHRGTKIEINETIHKTDILVVKNGFEEIARQRIIDKEWKTIKIR